MAQVPSAAPATAKPSPAAPESSRSHESGREIGPRDRAFQRAMLAGVSRTFALTIPELPRGLSEVVSNGYLLCRIADTIEDEPALTNDEKRDFHERFARAVEGELDPSELSAALAPRLSERTLETERVLVRTVPRVLAITHSFPPRRRAALSRCVRVMCRGMDRFQREGRPDGLPDVAALGEYCYVVAGVVGEMLTELFCDHAPDIEERRPALERRAVSFGQGLQMTNILKDVWDDLERGFCWLPRDVFGARSFDLADLRRSGSTPEFQAGMVELVGIARGHLEAALEYTLEIPARHAHIRRFCLWALGMAVLTLRKIHRRIGFRASSEVKITRRSVRATVLLSNVLTKSDRLLRLAFDACAAPLPQPRAEVATA